MKTPTWRIAAYVIVVLTGLTLALPSLLPRHLSQSLPPWLAERQVALGLDLRGGAALTMRADVKALAAQISDDYAETIRARLLQDKIRGIRINADQHGVILRSISGTIPEPVRNVAEQLMPTYQIATLGVSQQSFSLDARTAGILRLSLRKEALNSAQGDAIAQSIEVVRRRVDEVGVSEPSIQRIGSDRIMVQMPGVGDPSELRRLLGSTAQLTFHRLAPDPGATGQLPSDAARLPTSDGQSTVVIEKRPALDGERLSGASSGFNPESGQPSVQFSFDPEGARLFAELTRELVGQPFAIVLDGKILSAPVIREPILGGSGEISGDFTIEETATLAALLRAGSLPVPLEVIEERTVGASLGSDSIQAGLMAGLLGLGLVVMLMVAFYGAWGLLASAILGLNYALTLAALSLVGATLTLPGVAGIILCLGIAVDANILIFSRIREETAGGARAMTALSRGYDRAWGTILDANITTLLAMVVLFWLGAGPIRGFAVTMSLGILISMFTAITLMRIVMEKWAHKRRLKQLVIPQLVGTVPAPGAWSFLRHGQVALIGSAVLSTLALAATFWPGPHWGIDFTGGAQMTLNSAQAIPLADLRLALEGFGDATLQSFGAPTEVLLRLQGEASQATVVALEQAVRAVVPDVVFARVDLVGPTISGELAWTGGLAMAAAVIAMLVYIWIRFEWHFAVSAILVLALDVTKTIGVIAALGWEVNLTTIVALLTLIGYSVNDKVVVYDRVRETMKATGGGSVKDALDRGLNQVLARCIFTSGTTLAALVPMALSNSATVAEFAWPMIAGVTIATASSLFVAGPLLVWMETGRKPNPVLP